MNATTRRYKAFLLAAAILGVTTGVLIVWTNRRNTVANDLLSAIKGLEWARLFELELDREKRQNGWNASQFACLMERVVAGVEGELSTIRVKTAEEVSTGVVKIEFLYSGKNAASWTAFAHRGHDVYRYELATLPLFLNKIGSQPSDRLLRLATAMDACGVPRIVGRAGQTELTPRSLRDVASGRASPAALWRSTNHGAGDRSD